MRRSLPLVTTLLFAIAVVVHAGAAQPDRSPRAQGAQPPDVPRLAPLAFREALPNGIRLLVASRPAIPIVVLRVSLQAGSAEDPADAPGLANLTAELLTRGTAKRTGPELDQAIEFVGGALEADASRD